MTTQTERTPEQMTEAMVGYLRQQADLERPLKPELADWMLECADVFEAGGDQFAEDEPDDEEVI